MESTITQETKKSVQQNEKEGNKVLGMSRLDNSKNNESQESVSIWYINYHFIK